uniref:Meq oncoprotein n=1 Tax=Gallid alphaherpesvirus 2 TaxID=10390 RepID=A0A4D6TYN6_9ALPH|nr:meq oncoprotein [Gallid alphaherpesvirus 2]
MSQEPEPGAMPYSPADDPSPLDLSLGSTSRRKKRKSHDIPNSPSKHPFPDGLSEEEKQKLERRRKRNRDAARRRRRKQTDYVDKLHEACEELQRANEHLRKEIRDLRTECTSLRVQLARHEPVCPMAVPLTVTLGLLTTPHDPVPEPPICTPQPPSPDEPNAPHCSGSQPPICTPAPPDTEELCAQLCSTPPPPISTPHIIYAPGPSPLQPPICTPAPPDAEELCAQLCSTPPPPICTPHSLFCPPQPPSPEGIFPALCPVTEPCTPPSPGTVYAQLCPVGQVPLFTPSPPHPAPEPERFYARLTEDPEQDSLYSGQIYTQFPSDTQSTVWWFPGDGRP